MVPVKLRNFSALNETVQSINSVVISLVTANFVVILAGKDQHSKRMKKNQLASVLFTVKTHRWRNLLHFDYIEAPPVIVHPFAAARI